MCEKHNNIHKTVQNTFQHETVDLKHLFKICN